MWSSSTCIQLEELLLAETDLMAFQGGYFYSALGFPQLKTLQLDRNPNLQTLQIAAPKLQVLTAKHNPRLLYEAKIKRTCQVNFTDSPKVEVIYSTLECVSVLKGHTNWVKTLVQLADGILASGFADKAIKLWQ